MNWGLHATWIVWQTRIDKDENAIIATFSHLDYRETFQHHININMSLSSKHHLVDIREMAQTQPVQQTALLLYQGISPYPGKENMNAMDAAVCALRHIYYHTSASWRGIKGCTKPELLALIDKQEGENPLLKFAWSHLSRDEDCANGQAKARAALSHHLKENLSTTNLTFFSIMESALMHRTLFSREVYQLCDARLLSQPLDAKKEGKWVVDNGRHDAEKSAKDSLLIWDGQGDLSTFVGRKFGCFDAHSVGRRYFRYCNKPAILRVRYNAPLANPTRFGGLERFEFDGQVIEPRKGETRAYLEPEEKCAYILTMVVRLRMNDEDRDLVRRYKHGGGELLGPVDAKHEGGGWTLGEPNRQYMLYYAEAGDVLPKKRVETQERPKNSEEKAIFCYSASQRKEEPW
ncbi:hypothetical protein M426DRAFT_24421 [Hypoxylon sp. CI-4A]|nr:hypothetical protein M426DRAFT_24421 [Hypoxylon sp. CI-4A]